MITYTTNPKLTLDQVLSLYQAVEWTNYTANPDRLQAGLDGTLFMRAAYDGDRLVGLLRAVGDGATILFIQDILVLPTYQRQGIGTRLLTDCLVAYEGIYQCHLMTDQTEKMTAFYERLGFTDVGNLAARAYTYWKH